MLNLLVRIVTTGR